MSTPNLNGTGHSAKVQMTLYLNGDVLPIAQMGPTFIILKKPIEHPPVEKAELSMSIDGDEERWFVRLPEGISTTRDKTAIARCLVK